MIRADMISTVGRAYLTSNIENDEYSYPKAFSAASLTFAPIQNSAGRRFEKLDIRFVKDNISVLIETKQNFTAADEEQLSAYVEYEKALTGNKIIAILANTINDNVKVWRGVISDGDLMPKETALRTMDEYVDFYTSKINDKEKVMQNTYKLNEMLHRHSIPEKLRSQFVGTCLLALKNGLDYSTPSLTAAQIRTRIKEVLEDLLNSDINKAEKLALLNRNVLGDQYVRQLNIAAFREILKFIEDNILPFINDKSTSGQDLLNLFFVTFNKYVGKSDKNQAFTPDHVTDFMAKIMGVNKHSVVLDPCCGSGSFLVRAMTQALDDCATAAEQEEGNTISLSYNGSVGEAFYQPKPFWATDDVNVLYFREENGVAFNKYIALFVCAVLRQEKYRYSYGRKWVLESMKSTVIKLPEKSGKPNWSYMEDYMKSLPYGDRI